MTIDVSTAEKMLKSAMRFHANVAADAFDDVLTTEEREAAVFRAKAIRDVVEFIVGELTGSNQLLRDKYMKKIRSAISASYDKIVSGEWLDE
jgi:hypothetical protein